MSCLCLARCSPGDGNRKTWNNHSVNVSVKMNENVRCMKAWGFVLKHWQIRERSREVHPDRSSFCNLQPDSVFISSSHTGSKPGRPVAQDVIGPGPCACGQKSGQLWGTLAPSGRHSISPDLRGGCLNKLCCHSVFLKPSCSCVPTTSCVSQALPS